jgi:hypothetical protein
MVGGSGRGGAMPWSYICYFFGLHEKFVCDLPRNPNILSIFAVSKIGAGWNWGLHWLQSYKNCAEYNEKYLNYLDACGCPSAEP